MANLYFYTHPKKAFESWDFRNPDLYGIGNSETSQIEMARRLAARGHRVVNYAPVPADCPGYDRGVIWKHSDSATFSEPGVWILYRCPGVIDNFMPRRPDQEVWLICQDEEYEWTAEQEERVDWVVGLCEAHVKALESRHPRFRGRVRRSSNGCKAELVREVLAEGHVRNPKRLMYASSPDRALEPLLKAFQRAREFDSELELHVAYGFDNIDKVVADNLRVPEEKRTPGAKSWLKWITDLKRDLQGDGIVHHGRLSQPALYREWAKTGIWCYPNSRFRETSCLRGDSVVETLSGPVAIKDLVGKSGFHVWSCDKHGAITPGKVSWCKMTRQNAEVVHLRVRFGLQDDIGDSDRQSVLVLTPDHLVMRVDGTWVPAGELMAGDCLRGLDGQAVVMTLTNAGFEDVYCMEVEEHANFVADGIVVHNCATSMESQALGAIPIISRLWAVGENVGDGMAVEGDPYAEPLSFCTFAMEIVRMANAPETQERIRRDLMPWALDHFDWEVFANQWHRWILASGIVANPAHRVRLAA